MTVVSRPIDLIRQAWRIGRMALTALWAFKLRSFFVVLGVALGIASLTVIVAAVDGAERKATEIVKWFGPDAALVLGGDIQSRAVGQRTLTLSFKDAQKLRESLPGAYLVVPMRGKGDVIVRYRGRSRQVPLIVGTTDGYAEAWNWPLAEGRDFTGEDVQKGAKVGLIGDLVAEDLFGDESPVGHTIFVDQLPVQIVGRLSYRGVSGGGGSSSVDDRIILPITTLTQRFNLDRKYFRALRVKFYAPENMEAHVANLRSLLRHLHNLQPGDPDDFSILTADEILKFLSMFKGGLMLFLGITALVAIIVGGFVLANLFYLSVNRTPIRNRSQEGCGCSRLGDSDAGADRIGLSESGRRFARRDSGAVSGAADGTARCAGDPDFVEGVHLFHPGGHIYGSCFRSATGPHCGRHAADRSTERGALIEGRVF